MIRIRDRMERLYILAESRMQRTFSRPALEITLKGETAGQAWPHKNLIRLNPVLYLENQEHYLKQTVAHEIAHLIAYEHYGSEIRPHGREWQWIMTCIFQLPAERCHQYDTRRSSSRPYLYRCFCHDKHTPLSAIRHKRARRGVVYLCATCRCPLTFDKANPL